MKQSDSPEFERLIRAGLSNGSTQQPTQGQVWARVGNCLHCGAPIWCALGAPASERVPQSFYSCPCALAKSREGKLHLERLEASIPSAPVSP